MERNATEDEINHLIHDVESIVLEMDDISENETYEIQRSLLIPKATDIIKKLSNIDNLNITDLKHAKSRKLKAKLFSMKGKALEIIFQPKNETNKAKIGEKENEIKKLMQQKKNNILALLKRSIVLDKSLISSWNALGRYYQKIENFKLSKTMFFNSILAEKNKIAYQGLSTIYRIAKVDLITNEEKLSTKKNKKGKKDDFLDDIDDIQKLDTSKTTSGVAKNTLLREQEKVSDAILQKQIEKSIDFAKKAVTLDFEDDMSWYSLGNSYLYYYMLTLDDAVKLKSIKAYNTAEKFIKKKVLYPEIHHNRSVLYCYDSQFSNAYMGFKIAYQLDQTMIHSMQKMKEIKGIVKGSYKLMKKMKKKAKFQSMKKDIPFNSTFETVKEEKIAVKVIGLVSPDGFVPTIYLVVDKALRFGLLSVNFFSSQGIKKNDIISIFKPVLVKENFTFLKRKEEELDDLENQYKEIHVIKVFNLHSIHINKKHVKEKFLYNQFVSSSCK